MIFSSQMGGGGGLGDLFTEGEVGILLADSKCETRTSSLRWPLISLAMTTASLAILALVAALLDFPAAMRSSSALLLASSSDLYRPGQISQSLLVLAEFPRYLRFYVRWFYFINQLKDLPSTLSTINLPVLLSIFSVLSTGQLLCEL